MATRMILAAALLIPLLADSAWAQRGGPGGRFSGRDDGDDEGRGRGGFGRGGFDRGGFDRGGSDRGDRGVRGRDGGDSDRFRGRFGGEGGEGGPRGFGDRGGPGGFSPRGFGRPPGAENGGRDFGGRGFGGPGGGFGDRGREDDSDRRDFGRGGFSPFDRSRGFERSSSSDSRRTSAPQEKTRPARKPREPVTLALPEIWGQHDIDQDGQLGLYEWPRARRSELLQYDLNGDGFLTPRELASVPAPQIARAE
ncbi:hypothetical protein Mal4_12050 [Maioricimonas rarisocia]|uniref:EF hand n=1 Tax=Maioricimonas rarisocia TaxID=2528026 RepID=A0A517Z332_9PLAN|nr:hypothetical protein [Maioricimonas rarisocia]QDU36904.1 hypothetical protein Mal4_12050 [Maioricimonas rarisocia]